MLVSITIPTMKAKDKVQPMIEEIQRNTHDVEYEILASCINQSASKNRNWCIDNSKGDVIVMMDDDITGFYEGWCSNLIKPLIEESEKYSIVSARLLDRNKNIGPQMGNADQNILDVPYVKALHSPKTGLNIVCSACIAFLKNSNVRFNERYKGATYEDSDFCMSMNKQYPQKQIIINNLCKIVHLGEGKGRHVGNENVWLHNRKVFAELWGFTI